MPTPVKSAPRKSTQAAKIEQPTRIISDTPITDSATISSPNCPPLVPVSVAQKLEKNYHKAVSERNRWMNVADKLVNAIKTGVHEPAMGDYKALLEG